MNVKQAVPFFMVSNIERSLHFYVTGLGFAVKNTWEPRGRIEWCWLDREGVSLMLQEYREGSSAFTAEKGVGVSVCFMCSDAIALYHEFVRNGLSPNEPFVGNGLWDVGIRDPDNYSLHFESPTDVPEDTRYFKWAKDRSL